MSNYISGAELEPSIHVRWIHLKTGFLGSITLDLKTSQLFYLSPCIWNVFATEFDIIVLPMLQFCQNVV